MTHDELDQLQERLGYRYGDPERLLHALTHPSYNNERTEQVGDYQRLEFLGDAILGMLLAEDLYRRFPGADEGELSRSRAHLAGQGALAGIARSLGLGGAIRLGRGEELTGGRDKDSILSDVVEAIIATVYQDGGLEAARGLVGRLFEGQIGLNPAESAVRDAKSELQELLSARGLPVPEYRLVEESGPPHDRWFHFSVLVGGRVAGQGQGRSKKNAQQEAAGQALQQLSDWWDPAE